MMRTASVVLRILERAWAAVPFFGALYRVERLSHGGRATYVGNNRILTKCVIAGDVIGFFVEADDRLLSPWLILTGTYELPLTNYFLSNLKPDSHCLDVGANFGYFSCLMARRCMRGKVLGIEPDQHVYELVRDNIYINNLHDHAQARQAAVCDREGKLTLHRRVTRSGNTSIQKANLDYTTMLGEPETGEFEVDCLTIDSLLPYFGNRIDFVKIDVEGAEPLALRGAKKAIATNPHLRIVMEWSPAQIQGAGFDIGDFVDEMADMGLQAADIGRWGWTRRLPIKKLLDLEYRAGILLSPSR